MIITSTALIKSRINNTKKIVNDLMAGSLKPDKIYFFISEEPFNLDEGIKPDEIPLIDNPKVEFIYTKNIGSLRKIIPIVKMYWTRPNTRIIVCDDDRKIKPDIIKKLIDYSQHLDHRFHACATAGNVFKGSKESYKKKGVIYETKNKFLTHGIVLGWAIKEPIQVDLLASGMQMLIKPKFFPKEDIFNFEKYIEEYGINYSDENFFSYLLSKNGINRFVIPINSCPTQYPVKKTLFGSEEVLKYKIKQAKNLRPKMCEWRNE